MTSSSCLQGKRRRCLRRQLHTERRRRFHYSRLLMIRFCGGLTKRPLDALNCFTCSHFPAIKKKRKKKTTTKSTGLHTCSRVSFLCFFVLLFFGAGLFIFFWSPMIAVGAQSLGGAQIKAPGTCECAHVFGPPASSAEQSPTSPWARCSLIKSSPGLCGREENVFTTTLLRLIQCSVCGPDWAQ